MSGQETGGTTPHRYTAELANAIEARWQERWEELGTFYTPNPVGDLAGATSAEKVYILDMFSYPSGKGLHVGHPLGYIATDTIARYQRMLGKNVLYTMGFDAFGLPAEQYAVQTGQHPRVTTEQNIANMRRQLKRIGFSHDSRRTFATTDVDYVRWTQWIFLQIYNSWYDPDAPCRDGRSKGSARPISQLRDEYDAGGPSSAKGRRARCSTRAVWPTSARPRSTGAPVWERFWPMRKSRPTGAPSAETSPFSRGTCGSG